MSLNKNYPSFRVRRLYARQIALSVLYIQRLYSHVYSYLSRPARDLARAVLSTNGGTRTHRVRASHQIISEYHLYSPVSHHLPEKEKTHLPKPRESARGEGKNQRDT